MTALAERDRRRLTVGRLESGPPGAGVPGDSSLASPEDTLSIGSLLAGKEAVSLCSTSDQAANKKAHFGHKDLAGWKTGSGEGENQDDIGSIEKALQELVEHSPIEAIAYKCHKGKKPESPNQDSFSILIVRGECALYCVYDGHGPKGHDVSEMVRKEIVLQFYRMVQEGMPIESAFKEAFKFTQNKLTDHPSIDTTMSGTTCTMVYHDFKDSKLYIAHVGDSRAVLGTVGGSKALEAQPLTIDHKPELADEKTRIENAGGRVVFDGYYNHRVFSSNGPYPGLNMSRALGDVVGHKEAGLSAEPDFKMIELAVLKPKHDKIILLICTDGVWEFVENDQAVTHLSASKGGLDERLEGLTQDSYDRWMKDSDNEISDDITGIAVIL